jgi:hypothetical protein
MADRDILDAVLRLESTNREDHQLLFTLIRGYAARTNKVEGEIDALANVVKERQESCIRRHKRLDAKGWALIGGFLAMALTATGRIMGIY